MRVAIESWSAWSTGENFGTLPELTFLASRMKRRMSQLSRMIVQVGHDLMKDNAVNDVVFASRYGELNKQLEITEDLLDDGEVSPAAFSQSVFNTPVALVSLHENVTGITRAVYAGEDSFVRGLLQSIMLVESTEMKRILFLFGDERIPDIYEELNMEPSMPMALGLLISSTDITDWKEGVSITLQGAFTGEKRTRMDNVPLELEMWLYGDKSQPFIIDSSGYRLIISGDGQ